MRIPLTPLPPTFGGGLRAAGRRTLAVMSLFAAGLSAGCMTPDLDESEAAPQSKTAGLRAESRGDAASGKECGTGDCGSQCDGGESCGGAEKGESCGGLCGETAGKVQDTQVRRVKRSDGRMARAVGANLAGARLTKVNDVLAHGDDYVGKVLRLEGDVTGMCRRKRGWFSIQDVGERDGRAIRVLAAPRFLVPQGAVGMRAVVEGKVDVLERKGRDGGDVKFVVLRATGAEFI